MLTIGSWDGLHRKVRDLVDVFISAAKSVNSILGAVNALYYFGAAVGALLQGYVADWLGRKLALAVAAGCSLVGGSLAAGAVNIPMLITVRILHGIGLGMIICLVPVYLTEVSPAKWRGFVAGLTTLSFSMGYVM